MIKLLQRKKILKNFRKKIYKKMKIRMENHSNLKENKVISLQITLNQMMIINLKDLQMLENHP